MPLSTDNLFPMQKISTYLSGFTLLCLILLSSCSTSRSTTSSSSSSSSQLTKEDRKRRDVVAYAKKFTGTKYKYGGKSPKGFDCSGFTSYVMSHFNIKLSSVSRYQAGEGKKVDVKRAKPGDLIFYKRSSMGKVFHVSLVVSNDRKGLKVIHATSRGVVIDNVSESSYWKPKVSSARDVIAR